MMGSGSDLPYMESWNGTRCIAPEDAYENKLLWTSQRHADPLADAASKNVVYRPICTIWESALQK